MCPPDRGRATSIEGAGHSQANFRMSAGLYATIPHAGVSRQADQYWGRLIFVRVALPPIF